MSPLVDHLTARAAATFGPRGWPLLDAEGAPLRSTEGVVVRAQVRTRPGSDDLLHEWRSDTATPNLVVGLLQLPGDTLPQVVALLTATAQETTGWTWRCCPYDVLVTAFGRTDEVVRGDFTVRRGVTR